MRLISPHRQLVLPRRGRGVWRDKKKVVGSGVVRAVLCERAKTGFIISTKIAQLKFFVGRLVVIAFQYNFVPNKKKRNQVQQSSLLRAYLYAWSLPQHEFPFVRSPIHFVFSEIFAFFLRWTRPFPSFSQFSFGFKKKPKQTKESGSEGGGQTTHRETRTNRPRSSS